MTDLSALSKQSVQDLGPGAYLVTALPSTFVVLAVFVLVQSRLYPGVSPALGPDNRPLTPGVESVGAAVRGATISGGVALVVGILVLAVVLRPFQVRLVQILEGYWSSRLLDGIEALAVERHRRRRIRADVRRFPRERDSDGPQFEDVLAHSRRRRRAGRIVARAKAAREVYPAVSENVMPTTLGNILRRAETTAGERYGLATTTTYPRLYPHLSSQLDREVANQLNVLDTSATFTVAFTALTVASAPLLARLDRWSLAPLGLLLTAAVAYRGAQAAASRYAILLHTAYDLHRFDMLRALKRRTPVTGVDEVTDNRALSAFLASDDSVAESGVGRDRYDYDGPSAAGLADPRAPRRRFPR